MPIELTDRRAILIGVPDYPRLRQSLACVQSDLERMSSALASSGYAITAIVSGSDCNSKAELLTSLIAAFDSCSPSSVLVVYFTGHGFGTKEGIALLTHEYADDDHITLFNTALMQRELEELIEKRCKSRLIVMAIDACRDSVEAPPLSLRLGVARGVQDRLCWYYSCDHDQRSRFRTSPPRISHFTEGLSDTIRSTHPAITLDDVYNDAQDLVNEITDTLYGKETNRQESRMVEPPRHPVRRVTEWVIFNGPQPGGGAPRKTDDGGNKPPPPNVQTVELESLPRQRVGTLEARSSASRWRRAAKRLSQLIGIVLREIQ